MSLAADRTGQAKGYPEAKGPDDGGSRRQILNAAASLLRSRGYQATTTRAIAQVVGIKAGTIYHYFPSKDAIVAAVVDEGVRVVHDAVVGALAALPPEATPHQRLTLAVKQHLLSSLEHGDYTSASIRAFAFLPTAVRRGCRLERRRYEEVWRGLVEECRKAGLIDDAISPDSVRLLILGAVNWAGEWYRPDRMNIDAIARDFASCILSSRPEPAPADHA